MNELTTDEQHRLTELERVIDDGVRMFVRVGQALAEIRDQRLYRRTHGTFEEYCRERWGFNDSRARQLIAAAETVTDVTGQGLPSPQNEGQARELNRPNTTPEQRAEVWERTLERTDGRPTGRAVRETWDALQDNDDDALEGDLWVPPTSASRTSSRGAQRDDLAYQTRPQRRSYEHLIEASDALKRAIRELPRPLIVDTGMVGRGAFNELLEQIEQLVSGMRALVEQTGSTDEIENWLREL